MTRYVYVIGAQIGPVKIGVAAMPRLRMREIQIGYPFELKVLAQFAGGEKEEAAIHELFREQRLRGEWFKRSKRLRHFVDMVNCGVSVSLIIARLDPSNKTRAGEMYRNYQDEEHRARIQREQAIQQHIQIERLKKAGLNVKSVSVMADGNIRVDVSCKDVTPPVPADRERPR
jgi:hypothetical protein